MSQVTSIPKERALLENHLRFLETHRGAVNRGPTATTVVSDRPEFTFAIPEAVAPLGKLIEQFNTFYVYPWAPTQGQALTDQGYSNQGALSYMILKADTNSWRSASDLQLSQVSSSADMDTFSEIQCRGFLETEEAYTSWQPWLKAANQRNLRNPDQLFYIGASRGHPAGVTLVVANGDVAGIYAVATLPSYRKQGVSAAIMKRAISDSRARGCTHVILQVLAGSYAESFYKKLGFETFFETKILGKLNADR